MSTVLTVLKYDLRRFLRDWLMLAASVLILVIYVAVVAFVPEEITPTWDIAVTEAGAEPIAAMLEGGLGKEARIEIKRYATEADMRAAFEEGASHFVGIALDPDARAAMARGQRVKARIYVDESTPPEAQETARAIGAMMATAAFLPDMAARGEPVTLGPVVEHSSFKARARALMAILILVVELLALASLLSREISSGVVHAILTTTVSLPRYFVAKMAFGVVLAFAQAWTVAALSGALAPDPLFLTTLLLLGAIMFTGMGVISGTRGRHLMEVILWSMLFMLPSLVPALVVMLPGSPPLLVQLLPSYPLVAGVLSAGQSAPLVAPWVYLAWSAAWAAGLALAAYVALRRRVT